jgi:dihydroorotate dehydrogenase
MSETKTVTIEKHRGKPKGKYSEFVLYVYNQLKNLNKKIDKINQSLEQQRMEKLAKKCVKDETLDDDFI